MKAKTSRKQNTIINWIDRGIKYGTFPTRSGVLLKTALEDSNITLRGSLDNTVQVGEENFAKLYMVGAHVPIRGIGITLIESLQALGAKIGPGELVDP